MVSKILTVTVPNDPVQVIEVQVPGSSGPAGPPGPPGPSDIISIGTITTGAPGSQASATISGATPNRQLNLTIPQGPQGNPGPATALTIGTINTLAEGQSATATITGTAPNQTLNLSIPRGYGVRSGGASGDVLTKLSATDYDTGWVQATRDNVANTIVKRDSTGDSIFRQVVASWVNISNAPSAANDATRKDYVDDKAKRPGAVWSSSNTSNTQNGYWWKIGTLTITSQFADANLLLSITAVGSGSGNAQHARIHWRAKQQNALGQAPTTSLTVVESITNGSNAFGQNQFMTLVESNTASSTVISLWVSNPEGYSVLYAHEESFQTSSSAATFAYAASNQAGVAALPAGTQISAVARESSAGLANTVALRDSGGHITFNTVSLDGPAPTQAYHATRKDYVDALGTASTTPNTIVRRDAAGGSVFAYLDVNNAPTAPANLTRKDYVDALGVSTATANTIARRNGNGDFAVNLLDLSTAPTQVYHATRKDYVDGQVATKAARQLAKNSVTASYTVVAGDATDTILHSTSATAITITLPQDTAATISQEISIPWRQYGAGQITFAAGTGATLVSRGSVFKSAGQYAEGLLTKVAANTWLLSGDIVA